MARFFNIAGPCVAHQHYMLEPSARVGKVQRLIEREEYFVIHAPRQSGKTTLLEHLSREINGAGRRLALYVSLEEAHGLRTRAEAIPAIIRAMGHAAADREPFMVSPEAVRSFAQEDPNFALGLFLRDWCRRLPKPLVLLLDEVDCLTDDALLSFLRQLRSGYVTRSQTAFPSSVALTGMRNLRDYRVQVRPEAETLGTASPFNIIADALTLRDFSREEIAGLYGQHTAETGQIFQPEAVAAVYESTHGQPWLVNALARLCVDELVPNPKLPVASEHVDEAKEALIRKRPTHLDSLMARLAEERVQRVMEPILRGESGADPNGNDYLFVTDLGLIRREEDGTVVSNAIYRELIPRYLNSMVQEDGRLPGSGAFPTPDGGVDVLDLLRSFQQFWRENSEIWIERFTYREAGPHLVLQAYLQNVFNGAGNIIREYAAGTGRVDLCLRWGKHRYAIEIKAIRPRQSPERVQAEGLDQLGAYLDRLGLDSGCLLIFDQRPGRTWDDRIYEKAVDHKGRRIAIFGA